MKAGHGNRKMSGLLTVVCVLRSGGDYVPAHVLALRDGVRRHLKMPHTFVCLTDLCDEVASAGIVTRRLSNNWPGWWSKIELFHPAIRDWDPTFEDRVFYADLDTIIAGPLDDIVLGHQFTVLRNFWRDDRIGSGLMAWDTDLSEIYRRFASDPEGWMREYKTPDKWGDQQFIFDNSPIQPERWQDKHPGRVVSYKRDIVRLHRGKVPPEASIICYHGRPRPWETKLWPSRTTPPLKQAG